MAFAGLEHATVLNVFDDVALGLPSVLVGYEQRQGLQQAAQWLLPSRSGISIECRLAKENARCDFLSMIYRQELDSLSKFLESSKFDGIRPFFHEWGHPDSTLNRIPAIALECDVIDGNVHSPFVSATIEPDFEQGAEVVLSRKNVTGADGKQSIYASTKTTADRFLRCVDAGQVSSKTLNVLGRCYDSLSAHGCIYHISSQYHRHFEPKSVVRIIVSLPASQMKDYLRCLDWPGNVQHLDHWLPKVLPDTHRANFDVYIHEGWISPVIGVYMQFFSPRPTESRWGKMHEWLQTLSTCCPEKLIGLGQWIENTQKQSGYRQELGLKIKIGHHEKVDPEIKAYFSYLPKL